MLVETVGRGRAGTESMLPTRTAPETDATAALAADPNLTSAMSDSKMDIAMMA